MGRYTLAHLRREGERVPAMGSKRYRNRTSTSPSPTAGRLTARERRRARTRRRVMTSMVVVLTVAVAVVVVVWRRDDASKAADETFAGATVEVSLTDYSIAGALTDVPAGPVRLHVTNDGGAVHNVGLRGGPITTDLQPGRTTTLDL